MVRNYAGREVRNVAAEIASDVVGLGESVGWAGTEEEVSAVAEILKPFSIGYVDDFHGTWKQVKR